MKHLFFAVLLLFFSKSGHSQARVTMSYPSATLIDSLANVKIGDVIYIQGPSIKPLSGVHSYRYVYPVNFIIYPTRVQGIQGTKTYKTKIEELITFGGKAPIYAKVKDVNSDEELYVEVVSAFRLNEAVPELPTTLSRIKMFQLYLKTTKETSDNLAIAYMNAFDRPTHKLDEFEKRTVIGQAKLICDSLRRATLPTGSYIIGGAAELGEYDFQKKQFMMKGMNTEITYNLPLDKELRDCVFYFPNMTESMALPLSEKDAQELAGFYKEGKLERNVYYYYSLELTTTNIQNVIGTDIMGSPQQQKYFVQKAKVNSIHVFADPYLLHFVKDMKL